MLAENSKYIPGFDKRYSVTDDGRVYRHSFIDKRGALHKGRWLKGRIDTHGYVRIDFCGKPRYVHRLVASAFIPNPCNLPQINHIDGDRQNNYVSNLEWVDASQNSNHAFDTGLSKSGEDHHSSILSNDDVKSIRIEYSIGDISQSKLADKYMVSRSCISAIVSGRNRRRG